MDSLASRYALAIFEIALEENKIQEYQEKIKCVSDIFNNNPDYMRVLSSYFLSVKQKHELVEKAFESLKEKHIISFLKVIIDNHRVNEIQSIFKEFHTLCNKHLGIEEGIVYSVIPLSEEQIENIEKAISKRKKVKVELSNVIDERLIGGIKVVVHDHVYDSSILYKINSLKKGIKGER
jgi:F-type H+-transporting ATPase subunit delta